MDLRQAGQIGPDLENAMGSRRVRFRQAWSSHSSQPCVDREKKKKIKKADRQWCTCPYMAVAPRRRVAGAFACGGTVWGLQQMQLPPADTAFPAPVITAGARG